MKLIKFLDQSRIWVSLAAAAMTAEFLLITGIHFSLFLLLQTFFLTWAAYLFLERRQWRQRRILILISATGVVLIGMLSEWMYWWIWLICGSIVLLYQQDLFAGRIKNHSYELRRIPFVKPMAIALAWTLITSVLPNSVFVENGILPNASLVISNFFFVTALAIAEDICDARIDDVKTIATLYGTRIARIFANVFLSLSAFFYLVNQGFQLGAMAMGFMAVLVLSGFYITTLKPSRQQTWQPIIIDGMFILRFAFVFFAAHV